MMSGTLAPRQSCAMRSIGKIAPKTLETCVQITASRTMRKRALEGFDRLLRRKKRRGGDDDLRAQRVQRPRDGVVLIA